MRFGGCEEIFIGNRVQSKDKADMIGHFTATAIKKDTISVCSWGGKVHHFASDRFHEEFGS